MKEELRQYLTLNESEHSAEAFKFYSSHMEYKTKTVDELHSIIQQKVKEACWYFTLASINPTKCKRMGFEDKPGMLLTAIELLNEQARELNWRKFKLNSLPELRKRLVSFHKALKGEISINDAFESLNDRRSGNTNALKLGSEQQACLQQFFLNTGKLKTAARLYQQRAEEMVASGYWTEKDSKASNVTLIKYLKRARPVRT